LATEKQPPLPEPLDGSVFDSHCHFEHMAIKAGVSRSGEAAPAAYISEQMAKARKVGVTRVINVGCEVTDWQHAIDSTLHPDVFATLALHPTEVRGVTDEDYAELERLLAHPKVVAVGETGLDYYWDRTTPDEQQRHFRRHIDLAKRVGKPLVIHDRDAHADVLRILQEEGAPDVVVFHAFSGDAAMARECVQAGYYLSLPGVLTFKNAPALREAAQVAPLEHLLVETDAPFLTAHPYRGQPNAPYLVPHVVRLLAALKSTTERVVCDTISASGSRIFDL